MSFPGGGLDRVQSRERTRDVAYARKVLSDDGWQAVLVHISFEDAEALEINLEKVAISDKCLVAGVSGIERCRFGDINVCHATAVKHQSRRTWELTLVVYETTLKGGEVLKELRSVLQRRVRYR